MKRIEVKILNESAIDDAAKMAVVAARLTQRAEKITCMDDFIQMYNKEDRENFKYALTTLPHPTLQKLGVINIAIVGASRRFLAQVTRHQNEVKFMSGSLQYSNYGNDADFAVPYNILAKGPDVIDKYLSDCKYMMGRYKEMNESGIDNDSCGYVAPQGLRNVLIISATPYQWKHMISQRTCRRNTDETRIVFLKIWSLLYQHDPIFFNSKTTGPFCLKDKCEEGNKSCKRPISMNDPERILRTDYPLLEVQNAE